jgi:hypothetical protein
LLASFLELLGLLRCDIIVPIYQEVVYTGACHYSVKAVIWMFSAALITSLAGLTMITLRSALYPTFYVDIYVGKKESAIVEDNDCQDDLLKECANAEDDNGNCQYDDTEKEAKNKPIT